MLERKPQTSEALQRSENRYRRLLDSVTGYVYSVTVKDGLPGLTVHKPAFEALVGFTPNDYSDKLSLEINPMNIEQMMSGMCDILA